MAYIKILDDLLETIQKRKNDDPELSYTAKLLKKGTSKIAKKVGEEATEVVIASLVEDKDDFVGEVADLMYHLSVLLADKNTTWTDIANKLESRMAMSGLEEKAARKMS